jgi:hypothetical protein
MDELVEAAAGAAIGALTKVAAEPALTAGRKVWDWLKGKLSGDDQKTAAAVEAEPTKPSASTKVTALLQDLLHGNIAAVDELRRLLDAQGGIQAITQTASFTGDSNKVAQVAGNNNKTRIG